MPDRIDLDALLIGALYGELTPADEARLTAHLESHPADRTALADLRRTRAAIHENRLLTFQAEPPQAISAVLLQEAARRAPRRADREGASWFQRFVRSFMVHPAMAAAATIVLVVGVAGTLYLRGVHQFAETSPPPRDVAQAKAAAPAETVVAAAPAMPAGNAAVAPVPPPPAAAAAPSPEPGIYGGDRAGAGSASTGAAEGADGYRVGLADGAKAEAPARAAPKPEPPATKTKAGARALRDEENKQAELAKLSRSDDLFDDRPAKPVKKADKKPAAIVVRTPELALKETDEDEQQARVQRGAEPAAASERGRRRGGDAPGGAGGAPAAAPPAVASAPEPAPPVASADPRSDAKRQATRPAPTAQPQAAPSQAPPQAPPPPPADSVDNRVADKGAGPAAKDAKQDQKPAQNRALLDWARKQHGQVVALVNASNCRAAASAAIEIYSRAPDYYAANVVTDRSVKPCLAYLNNQRDYADRARAKNAAPEAADTQASPPVRK